MLNILNESVVVTEPCDITNSQAYDAIEKYRDTFP